MGAADDIIRMHRACHRMSAAPQPPRSVPGPFGAGCRVVILAGWVWGAWSVAAQEPDFGLSARELVVGLPSPLTPSATAWVEAETALDCAPRGAWQAVMASLDEAMPPGTELEVEVLTPGEAVGFGRQRLSERSSVLVFRLPASMRDPLRLRYRFRHDLLAATGSFSRSVLFTLIDP